MNKLKEIERKFLVKRLPEELGDITLKIEQSYLSLEPEVRIRKVEMPGCTKRELTVKSCGDIERTEVNTFIGEDEYQALSKMVEGNKICKTRYKIGHKGHTLELDIYDSEGVEEENFMVVEVEFKTIEDSKEFKKPSWFGSEVTKKKEYKNKNIAMNGFPKVKLKAVKQAI